MSETYVPPNSYWKEVRKHEAELYRNAWREKRGLFTEARVGWSVEAGGDMSTLWSNARMLGAISTFSTVQLAERVTQDSAVSGGGYFSVLHYCTSRLALPEDRLIKRYEEYVYVTDINDPEELQTQLVASKESRRKQDALGLSRGRQQDYDLLLYELQRGSSGEYNVDDDWDPFQM